MESKITIIRDNNGKVLGTKRQNPPTKPVIKKPLMNTEAEYAARRKSCVPKGFVSPKIDDPDYCKSQKHKPSESAKTEFPPKTFPTASDRYLQQQEKLRPIENAARPKSTGYRPLDNKVKGGFERAIDKMHQLGETKAELAEKFAKLLEFCKKYGKSFKA